MQLRCLLKKPFMGQSYLHAPEAVFVFFRFSPTRIAAYGFTHFIPSAFFAALISVRHSITIFKSFIHNLLHKSKMFEFLDASRNLEIAFFGLGPSHGAALASSPYRFLCA